MQQVVLMGGGRFAGLLYCIFKDQFDFCGYLDDVYEKAYIEEVYGLKKLGTSQDADNIVSTCSSIAIAIGAERDVTARKRYFDLFKNYGFNFPRMIHKTAQVYIDFTRIGEGVVVHNNVIIQPQVTIGENCIISNGSIINHDVYIGKHTFIAPGVILNGSTKIGQECFIGTGSVVIQKRTIGNNVVIGASSCVVNDVADGEVVFGVPAKAKK
jgi:sugar O-acyltransferase (sialic acid O-acetyltransferase NeuD family)